MNASILKKLERAYKDAPDAIFSLFTLSGHVLSGRIMAFDSTVTLEAGKETAEVPTEQVEAFSCRQP